MKKIHSLNEIELSLTKERHKELLDLSENINEALKSTSIKTPIEQYSIITEANEKLNNDLEKDLFASNIAFPDEEILTAILRMNNINIIDLLTADSITVSKEEKINSLKKLENFRKKYYSSALMIDLLNKINQIIIFSPNLLTSHEELDKIIQNKQQIIR